MRIDVRSKRTEHEWSELTSSAYRAASEHVLKISSWSVLVAAVRYAAEKNGDWRLMLCASILAVALFGYMYSLVSNIEIELFAPAELKNRRKFWITIIANVVLVAAIFLSLNWLSFAIVTTFVQIPK